MIDDFESAVQKVLANEGGYSENPNDPGGATNYGISLRFLREIPEERLRKYGLFSSPTLLSIADIKNLTIDQAKLIYRGEFWEKAPFSEIKDSDISDYLFDMCVNHGVHQGIVLLQRAIWAYYEKREYGSLLDDGILGEQTLSELQTIAWESLRTALCAERAGYVRLIVALNTKEKEFLNGWLDRCYRI